MRKAVAAIAALAALSLATAANAAVIVRTFTLDTTNVPQFTGGNFGTVTVVENGIDMYISVALADGFEFRSAPDSSHHALTFDLDDTSHTLKDLKTNVATTTIFRDPGFLFTAQPFGSGWNYAVDCTRATGHGANAKNGCIPGYKSPPPPGTLANPLSGLNPTKISLVVNNVTNINQLKSVPYRPDKGPTKNIWFAVDVVNARGYTGSIGASFYNEVSYAPEPGSWALMILGFGCLGADLRRRRRVARSAPAA